MHLLEIGHIKMAFYQLLNTTASHLHPPSAHSVHPVLLFLNLFNKELQANGIGEVEVSPFRWKLVSEVSHCEQTIELLGTDVQVNTLLCPKIASPTIWVKG